MRLVGEVSACAGAFARERRGRSPTGRVGEKESGERGRDKRAGKEGGKTVKKMENEAKKRPRARDGRRVIVGDWQKASNRT